MGSDSKAIPSDWEIITIYNNALVLVKKKKIIIKKHQFKMMSYEQSRFGGV